MKKQSEKPKKAVTEKQPIGELLLEYKLITKSQLQQALKRQTQRGGYLGSLLIEMDFISLEDFLDFLSKHFGVQAINLFKYNIDQSVIGLLPKEKIKSLSILPIALYKKTLTLAMVNPQDFMTISEVEFTLGVKVQPVVVPYFMMDAATKSLKIPSGGKLSGSMIADIAAANKEKMQEIPQAVSLLRYLAKSEASDMLLTAGAPPSIKIHNELKRLSMPPLTPFDCERYAKELIPDHLKDRLSQKSDFDVAVSYPDVGRFRLNVYKQRNSISIALRNIIEEIPKLKDLNLPEWIKEYALKPQGLILITGPAGHGKSTTLWAMVDIINENKRSNIVTLEDPIEYLHKHKKSNVNQREVGIDVGSFQEGLRNIFRQTPDVIVIGEMRDRESYEIALKAANTGHLVLSTVHADNSTSIIERIINMYPFEQQDLIRNMLTDALLLSVSQRLIPVKRGPGRILAIEKTVNSLRIKNIIREKKTHQIRTQLQIGAEDFTPLDVSIAHLYNSGFITYENALQLVEDNQFFKKLTKKRQP